MNERESKLIQRSPKRLQMNCGKSDPNILTNFNKVPETLTLGINIFCLLNSVILETSYYTVYNHIIASDGNN